MVAQLQKLSFFVQVVVVGRCLFKICIVMLFFVRLLDFVFVSLVFSLATFYCGPLGFLFEMVFSTVSNTGRHLEFARLVASRCSVNFLGRKNYLLCREWRVEKEVSWLRWVSLILVSRGRRLGWRVPPRVTRHILSACSICCLWKLSIIS